MGPYNWFQENELQAAWPPLRLGCMALRTCYIGLARRETLLSSQSSYQWVTGNVPSIDVCGYICISTCFQVPYIMCNHIHNHEHSNICKQKQTSKHIKRRSSYTSIDMTEELCGQEPQQLDSVCGSWKPFQCLLLLPVICIVITIHMKQEPCNHNPYDTKTL